MAVPSVFSHAVAALALGTSFRRPGPPARFWVAGAACAMVPDLDIVGLWLGVPWGHVLGHRGITHSLAFAAALAALVAWALSRDRGWDGRRGRLWAYLFVATASHGVLDAMNDAALGVAFFAPFDARRYFLPWRPIPVAPFALRFFSARGWRVFQAELLMIWLPAAVLALACVVARRRARPAAARA
ncbi:MAG: metal-dependent hydrolase [Candidatus Rokuibacteriota bacterium]|nr:MAG: metal-dependent hydrolase [Candidatus Rokubacteria bacterium]